MLSAWDFELSGMVKLLIFPLHLWRTEFCRSSMLSHHSYYFIGKQQHVLPLRTSVISLDWGSSGKTTEWLLLDEQSWVHRTACVRKRPQSNPVLKDHSDPQNFLKDNAKC